MSKIAFPVALVLLIVVAGWFIISHVQATTTINNNIATIASDTSKIASLQNQLSAANTQITTDNTQITNLQGQLSAANTQVTSLQGQLTAATTQNTSLQGQVSAGNTQATSLQTQLSAANTQVTTLQNQLTAAQSQNSATSAQLATLQSQVTSYQSQITSLQSQVASLGSQATSSGQTTLFSSQPISQGPSVQTLIYSYTPTYTGNLTISGSSSSATGYIFVVDGTTGASNTYTFGTGTTSIVPLTASNTYSIYFGNHDASGTIVGTLTGTYGSSSTSSGQITLFSSQPISQGPSVQTMVYTYTPTYTGYLNISGSSSSATGYIFVVNATTGASNTYTFGTGTTVSAPLTASNTYSIYFGNHDASGTIVGTLTGTYATSSSSSNQTTLFSAQPISQGPSVQTMVYTFTPTYAGYLNISGSSSSSTGYVLILATSSGTTNTYTFGTGTTVSIPLAASTNYQIYFGNHDSSGTISASLTGTYQQ